MVSISSAIEFLLPNAISLTDFVVSDDGTGPQITFWNTAKLGPQPTPEQLAAVAPQVELAQAKRTLADLRYAKETGGISIEGQRFSTERDEIGHWYPRFASAAAYLAGDTSSNPTGQYPYKPKGSDPVVLTPQQVVRAYECIAWYINSCFATEATGVYMLSQGMSYAEMIAAVTWPQTEFTWTPPE